LVLRVNQLVFLFYSLYWCPSLSFSKLRVATVSSNKRFDKLTAHSGD
jgi:hypothetical protein